MRVSLAVFLAALGGKFQMLRVTGGQYLDFEKAVECVRYITDFGLTAWYASQTDSTVDYMDGYLQQFHKTEDVFVRYRAGKDTRKRAEDVWKKYTQESKEREEAAKGLTAAQQAWLAEDKQAKRACRIAQSLKEDSHFTFSKLHPLSHYTDQINKYGSLTQYSTEICKAIQKPLMDADRQSNNVDSIPKVINAYAKEHNFVVHQFNMQHWPTKDPSLVEDWQSLLRQWKYTNQIYCAKGEPVCMRISGKCSTKTMYRLRGVSEGFNISALVNDIIQFFANNAYGDSQDLQADAERCLTNAGVACFRVVEIPIPNHDVGDGNIHEPQHVRETGKGLWRGIKGQEDFVCVNVRETKMRSETQKGRIELLNDLSLGYSNALFNLQRQDGKLFKLVHVSLLRVVRNPTPHGL